MVLVEEQGAQTTY